MAKEINLKDFSISESIENKQLYNKLNGESCITLDNSICEVIGDNKEIKPILEIIKSDENNHIIITTFGFVGKFTYFGTVFNITYRFGKSLLNRMITLVNDFDIQSLEYEAKSKNTKTEDSLSLFILYMNFILKLEKLSVIGIPKSYKKIEHHTNRLKGQVDINRFIKKDMPFQGKIASTSYEQVYVQEIIDVLYGALVIIDKSMPTLINDRIFGIKNLINHHANQRFVDERTLQTALSHKSIQNSLYGDYKNIIKIAGYIIRYSNPEQYKANYNFSGLIFDVSLLWESYLYALLKSRCSDWEVIHEEETEVYKTNFFIRNIKPDIVMEKDNKIMVFDAKSKRMEFRGRNNYGAGDLDRSDFFQINTYMTYYDKQGYEVIAGGLLYPIEEEFDESKAHSNNWFGDSKTKFIVDGIDLSYIEKDFEEAKNKEDKDKKRIENILTAEDDFIKRIKDITSRHKADD
jgi:5-methylcytosine-specific restriction endonuclease McrBC regulatory subunit McrC